MFMLSTSAGSSVVSEHILLKFLHLWDPEITPKLIEHMNAVARKCAHLTEYAILAVLLYRALHQGYQRKMTHAFRFTVAFSILFAMLDEYHQSYSASRTPSVWDVMIDAAGAAIGIGVLYLIHRRSQKPHRYILH